jgi:hypothetical protein
VRRAQQELPLLSERSGRDSSARTVSSTRGTGQAGHRDQVETLPCRQRRAARRVFRSGLRGGRDGRWPGEASGDNGRHRRHRVVRLCAQFVPGGRGPGGMITWDLGFEGCARCVVIAVYARGVTEEPWPPAPGSYSGDFRRQGPDLRSERYAPVACPTDGGASTTERGHDAS